MICHSMYMIYHYNNTFPKIQHKRNYHVFFMNIHSFSGWSACVLHIFNEYLRIGNEAVEILRFLNYNRKVEICALYSRRYHEITHRPVHFHTFSLIHRISLHIVLLLMMLFQDGVILWFLIMKFVDSMFVLIVRMISIDIPRQNSVIQHMLLRDVVSE